jgi:sec-independent protein translocase protein TatA
MNLLAVFMPGPMEMVICGMVALLLFGGRLPSVAKNIGASVYELRKGMKDAFEEIE